MTSADRLGILLVGHGTRDATGTRQFFQLAELLAAKVAPAPVESALLEFQSPTIEDAWANLVAVGATRVIVAPLLLFAAGHAKQDIPQIIARCQLQTPHVRWSQSRPLSREPALVALAVRRAREAIVPSSSPRDQRAFVLVGRGSHDPCAQADTRVLAELVGTRLPVAMATTAFYAMATPTVETTLAELATGGQFREIVVQPHLLFEGRLYQAIVRQVSEARASFPHVRFHVSDYLGPVTQVADAIAARVFATR